MKKYRKKPLVIHAIKWEGKDIRQLDPLLKLCSATGIIQMKKWMGYDDLYSVAIKTLEGVMMANPDDYIIRGIKGEFYTCKPDIFEATYEEVNE